MSKKKIHEKAFSINKMILLERLFFFVVEISVYFSRWYFNFHVSSFFSQAKERDTHTQMRVVVAR
jgi:hypothetical protein